MAAEAEAKAVAAPGKAPFSRTTSVPELDEGDLVVVEAAAAAAAAAPVPATAADAEADASIEGRAEVEAAPEHIEEEVVVEEPVDTGEENQDVDNDDKPDDDDGLDGIEVEMSEEEDDDDAAMDML